MEGTIKEYKKDKRYGFIIEDNKIEGENEIFFHFSAISESGFNPKKGDRVSYDSVESGKIIKGKPVMNAVNIRPLEMYFN
jgi:cold shock CspA family protein